MVIVSVLELIFAVDSMYVYVHIVNTKCLKMNINVMLLEVGSYIGT